MVSMQVTLALPTYRELHLQLAVLYQRRLVPGTLTLLPLSASLLSLLLGWLFEGGHFPRELLILARLQGDGFPQPQEAETLDVAEVLLHSVLFCHLLARWSGWSWCCSVARGWGS